MNRIEKRMKELQKKNEKYYVLKLAMSEDGTCFPMSNQVFNSY